MFTDLLKQRIAADSVRNCQSKWSDFPKGQRRQILCVVPDQIPFSCSSDVVTKPRFNTTAVLFNIKLTVLI
jgi:hypothetical protein